MEEPESTAIIARGDRMSSEVNFCHYPEGVLLKERDFQLPYSITLSEKSRPGSFGKAEMDLTGNQGYDNLFFWFQTIRGKSATGPATRKEKRVSAIQKTE
jgi:hypothetical protein